MQGFVRWAKGGLTGLIDPLKARDALLKALDDAGHPPAFGLAGTTKHKPKK